MAWLAANLAPLMFVALVLVLLSGVPVVFGLAACALAFAFAGVQLGVMPAALMRRIGVELAHRRHGHGQ